MMFLRTQQKPLLSTLLAVVLMVIPFPAFAADINGFIYNLCVGFGGFFLWIGGWMLDTSISYLVIGMGDMIRQEDGLGVAITQLWTVIRDIFNILFIFGLIYIGFQTILNAGSTNTKRLLGTLIAAALLINFSLFFTKAVIDFANIAAHEIYQLMDVTTEGTLYGEYSGISGAFMQFAKLQSYADVDLDEIEESESNNGNMLTIGYGFLIMIFLLVTAFVFIAGAVMLVTRFLYLVIIMIFSPVLLLGWVMPNLAGESKKWFERLINQALVAPAFLFMLYLSLVMIQHLPTNDSNIADMLDPSSMSGAFGMVLYICVMVGFVFASLLAAKQLGAVGAGKAVSMLESAQKKVRGGVQSWAGRNTIGVLSSGAQNVFTEWQEKPKENQSRLGKIARGGLAFTSLDRSIIGATEKGKTAKFGGSTSYKDKKDQKDERNRRLSAGAAEQRRASAIDTGKNEAARGGTVDQQTMKELADAMKGLTDKQLTEGIKFETLTNSHVAVHLTEKQIETLQKSGKYSDAQIADIKKARSKGFEDIATQQPNSTFNSERTPEWLSQKGTDEIAKMPTAVFTSPHMAPHLTPGMIEAKMKSGLSTQDRTSIQQAIDTEIQNDINANPAQGGNPAGGAYTKQWRNWVNRSPMGARLGLQNV